MITYRALKDIDKLLTSSTQVLKAVDQYDHSLRASKRGGVSGLAAKHFWVLLNLRYLGTAMQDHQALKTIWTEIVNILRTESFAGEPRTNRPRIYAPRHALEDRRFNARFCGSKALRHRRCLIARLQPTAVAETLSWFYFHESD